MTTCRISLPVDECAMPLVMVEPPPGSDKVPSLVIVPSIFGVADDLVAQMEEIAAAGALVFAMDPFFRIQPGPVSYDDSKAAIARLAQCDLRAAMKDFRFSLAHALAHPRSNGKVAVLGICFGAIFCLRVAGRGQVDGVVTWHGSGIKQQLGRATEMQCPMRLHFGEDDELVRQDTVTAVRTAFAGRSDVQVVVHPGAGHGYSHEGSDYQQAAERASVAAAIELLDALASQG